MTDKNVSFGEKNGCGKRCFHYYENDSYELLFFFFPFQQLDLIRKRHDLSLLFDEVQTGGGSTGRLWCHQHFDLPHGPDLVTFSKKMLSGGVFHNREHRPHQGNRIQNTWMGDPHKAIMLNEVLGVMREEDLLGLTNASGAAMLRGLEELQMKFPGVMSAARGRGTFCAFDASSIAIRYCSKCIFHFQKNPDHL